ncbi:MAG: hypothetical protein LAN63_14765 [Acidobacteriia bacterium]|nr:hypothetical protein [Terriglobia bacterium]
MTDLVEEVLGKHAHASSKQPLVLRVTDSDFQREVLERMGRLEAKMDMLVGSAQPGRMRLAEDRISTLEKNDIRRSVYDRLVNAAITVAISAAIALHDHLGLK